jgi:hypothetical protein
MVLFANIIDNQNLYFNSLSLRCIQNFICISLKYPYPLALLSFSPPCCLERRHVGKNARHVNENVAMLMEIPVTLEISSSCWFFGFHVAWEAAMLNMRVLKIKYPENLNQMSGAF